MAVSAAGNTDTAAIALLEAERALDVVDILLSVVPFSDMAAEELDCALDAIAEALQLKRKQLRLRQRGDGSVNFRWTPIAERRAEAA